MGFCFMRGGCVAATIVAVGFVAQAAAQESNVSTPTEELAGDARLDAEGAWRPNVTYNKDDLVTSRGSTWRSRHDNNKGHVPGSTNPNTAASQPAAAPESAIPPSSGGAPAKQQAPQRSNPAGTQ